jgi:predicted nucleic acid-binding protein
LKIVVDANLIAALALPLPYSIPATQQMQTWKRTQAILLAPALLEYEISTILRKAVFNGLLAPEAATTALEEILALNVGIVPPTIVLHHQALLWAAKLKQSKTYDAHYLAVAFEFQAQLWTADRRLANNAQQNGLSWVHWIGMVSIN